MVLQRAPISARIWGNDATAHSKVTVAIHRQIDHGFNRESTSILFQASVFASRLGKWSVDIEPQQPGTGFVVSVYSDDGRSENLTNVAFGDVFLCAGESNMWFPVRDSDVRRSMDSLPSNFFDGLAIMRVGRLSSPGGAVDRLPNIPSAGKKLACSSQRDLCTRTWERGNMVAYRDFSAVCLGTALHLRSLHAARAIPFGLVQVTWGASRLEAWSPPSTLRECPGYPTLKRGEVTEGDEDGAIYQGMLAPLLPMRLAAFMWYQVCRICL